MQNVDFVGLHFSRPGVYIQPKSATMSLRLVCLCVYLGIRRGRREGWENERMRKEKWKGGDGGRGYLVEKSVCAYAQNATIKSHFGRIYDLDRRH